MRSESFGFSRSTHHTFCFGTFSSCYSPIKLKQVSLLTPSNLQSASCWNLGKTTWGIELALQTLIMCFVIAAVSAIFTMKTMHLQLSPFITSFAPMASCLFCFSDFKSDCCTENYGVWLDTSFFCRFWADSVGLNSFAISRRCFWSALNISFAGFDGTTSAYVRKGDKRANFAIFCTFSWPAVACFLVALVSAMLLNYFKSQRGLGSDQQIRKLFEADLVCFAN